MLLREFHSVLGAGCLLADRKGRANWLCSPLYELGNYYILGRILYFVPHCSPIHPGRVLTTFAAISSIVEVRYPRSNYLTSSLWRTLEVNSISRVFHSAIHTCSLPGPSMSSYHHERR